MSKENWLKRTVGEFEPRLVRYACRFVPEAVARELVQETFLRLWQQEEDELRPHLAEWLFTVTRRQAIDWQRRAQNFVAAGDVEVVDPQIAVDDQLTHHQEQTLILKFIARLPFEEQEAMRLKFQEDMSYKQISAITGKSVSHVGVLIHSAMTKLRRFMEKSQ